MRPIIDTIAFDRSMAGKDISRLELQKRIISAMRPDDPSLCYANDLLRQMEQNAALNKMNAAFSTYIN